jgi:flavin reductase (DIM6/NTAB) family NADH-FMN oxidoreductase RutF
MNKQFETVNVKSLTQNTFKLIDDDWMLITAGTPDHFNTMTASWGSLGILWNKPVATCFIRPQRYTYEFANSSPYFTLSFFSPEYHKILQYCGAHSGKDVDKMKVTGLKPLVTEHGSIFFEQASLMLECHKLYEDDLKPENFIVPEIAGKVYANNDFHRFYIGEIVNCMRKK